MRGAAIGCSVEGVELSDPRFDPVWARAQDLGMLLFMHPQDSVAATGVGNRVRGQGMLGNVIGNPLETTIALSHLIFEGTLDRFPNLKLCAAHGGGYLPSYAARSDHGCVTFPEQCKELALKKAPTEYLRQIYVDSLLFTPEGLRHVIAEVGIGQVSDRDRLPVSMGRCPGRPCAEDTRAQRRGSDGDPRRNRVPASGISPTM